MLVWWVAFHNRIVCLDLRTNPHETDQMDVLFLMRGLGMGTRMNRKEVSGYCTRGERLFDDSDIIQPIIDHERIKFSQSEA